MYVKTKSRAPETSSCMTRLLPLCDSLRNGDVRGGDPGTWSLEDALLSLEKIKQERRRAPRGQRGRGNRRLEAKRVHREYIIQGTALYFSSQPCPRHPKAQERTMIEQNRVISAPLSPSPSARQPVSMAGRLHLIRMQKGRHPPLRCQPEKGGQADRISEYTSLICRDHLNCQANSKQRRGL